MGEREKEGRGLVIIPTFAEMTIFDVFEGIQSFHAACKSA
jgi:hypothetical protein